MTRISIIGGGNVAWHFSHIISKTNQLQLVQIINRSLSSIIEFQEFADITDDFNQIKPTDLFIICVSDEAIQSICEKLPNEVLKVHTSGSMPISVLKGERIGVFYPLQTFNKNKKVAFKTVPVLIESNNKKDEEFLISIAKLISNHVVKINSEERLKIHIAAVFVNNFVNHINYLAFDFLIKNNVNPNILLPLIEETALKLQYINPFDAQTGPAKRKDFKIIEKHLNVLKDSKLETLYKTLTKSISETYEEKL